MHAPHRYVRAAERHERYAQEPYQQRTLRQVGGGGRRVLQVRPPVDGIGHGQENRLGGDAPYGVAYGELRPAVCRSRYRGHDP